MFPPIKFLLFKKNYFQNRISNFGWAKPIDRKKPLSFYKKIKVKPKSSRNLQPLKTSHYKIQRRVTNVRYEVLLHHSKIIKYYIFPSLFI